MATTGSFNVLLWQRAGRVAALTIGLLAIYGRSRDPAVRFVEWIRALPDGHLVVRPGSGHGNRSL